MATLLAIWSLLSAAWSDAPARALFEFDRALLYLLAFGVMACFARRPSDLATVLRWVLAAIVVVAAGGARHPAPALTSSRRFPAASLPGSRTR